MTGFFWKTKDVNAFGAFTPSLGSGLYHVADPSLAPGMKLWSYGVAEDRAWATQGYVEIQGGPLDDQATKRMLEPNETRAHVEFWIPAVEARDISSLTVPNIQLRRASDIPLFDWARQDDVRVWHDLLRAHETKGRLPDPPPVDEAQRGRVAQHLAVRKAKRRVRRRRQCGIRPRHPGVGPSSGIVKHRALGEKIVVRPEGVFDRPLHAKAQLPLPAGHIHARRRAIDPGEDGLVLRGGMGNGKADRDSAGNKGEPGQYPHRLNDARHVQDFFARALMNEGCDFAAEVGANNYFDSIILQRDEPVLLPDGARRGRYIADVGIDTIGIECGRHRTSRREFMRENVILKLRTGYGAIAQVGRSTPPASASPCARLPLFSPYRNSVYYNRDLPRMCSSGCPGPGAAV